MSSALLERALTKASDQLNAAGWRVEGGARTVVDWWRQGWSLNLGPFAKLVDAHRIAERRYRRISDAYFASLERERRAA